MKNLLRLAKMVKRQGLTEIILKSPRLYYTRYKRLRTPTQVSYKDKNVQIHHRRTHEDLFGIWQCFHQEQYEVPKPLFCEATHKKAIDALYNTIVSRGDTPLIVDCGANIGAGSLWFLARYPKAHIVAVEPNASNIAVLKQNLPTGSTDLVEGAIAQCDGPLTFVDTGSTLSNQIADAEHTTAKTYSVNGYALKTIVGKSSKQSVPFILKMDVEGAEQYLFQDDTDVAQSFPMIIIEPHDFMLPGKSTSSRFLRFHADMKRDFLFWEENIFSIDARIIAR